MGQLQLGGGECSDAPLVHCCVVHPSANNGLTSIHPSILLSEYLPVTFRIYKNESMCLFYKKIDVYHIVKIFELNCSELLNPMHLVADADIIFRLGNEILQLQIVIHMVEMVNMNMDYIWNWRTARMMQSKRHEIFLHS